MKTKLFTLALAALTIGLLGSCKKEDSKVSVNGVTLDKTELTLTVGEADVKLTATVAPENATDKTVSWSSDKTDVATVDQEGNVHAVAPGIANITVTTTDGDKTATCVVTVKAAKVPVTGVTLDKTELTLHVGAPDVKLAATIAPENATDKTVSWSSDKTEFATVDNQGNVHAVAPGTANITVTTTDGGKTATCAVIVKAALPAGALPGVFSVSATKQVYFSKGNLYWDGDSFEFETTQYDTQSSWNASHVSHFFWSKTASVAYASSYNESGTSDSDVFFTNAETETAKSDFTVNGVTGQYRTLSKDEWVYLINSNGNENIRKGKYKYGVTVCDKANCLILAPDDFEGTIADSYDATAWTTAEAAGLVCLPAAGYRGGSDVSLVGDFGYCWSSTALGSDCAYIVYFSSYGVGPDGDGGGRSDGFSVRLITESK